MKDYYQELKNQVGKMDMISDMLIRIKNAQAVHKDRVEVPYSAIKMEIARVLRQNNYIKDAVKRGKKIKKTLDITLSYDADGNGVITDVKRISKLSKRVYKSVSMLRPVRQGMGIAVLSTSKGIMTDAEAKKNKVGGEVLFEIW